MTHSGGNRLTLFPLTFLLMFSNGWSLATLQAKIITKALIILQADSHYAT
jgi:hypothetical protein